MVTLQQGLFHFFSIGFCSIKNIIDGFIIPKISLPFCIIEFFPRDKTDKFFGFNNVKFFSKSVESFKQYYGFCSHFSSHNLTNSNGLITLISFS